MEGKIVKVKDISVIAYFYPDYAIKKELNFLDKGTKFIYCGKMKPKIQDYLNQYSNNWISVVGTPDMDISDNIKLAEYVFRKKGKEIPEKIKQQIETMEFNDLFFCLKIYDLTLTWPYDFGDSDVSIYNLFQGTIGPVKEYLETYFKLCKVYPFPIIEASMLTFLNRVINAESQEVSPQYSRLLKALKAKSAAKIKPAVMKYANSNQDNLAFLALLLDIR